MAAATGAVLMVQFEPVSLLGAEIPAGALASYTAAGLPLGPLGLAAGAALGAWVEWAWLRRRLGLALGAVGAGFGRLARMFAAALVAAAAARGADVWLAVSSPLLTGLLVAAVFGVVYLAAARLLGLDEARTLLGGVLRRVRRRRDH